MSLRSHRPSLMRSTPSWPPKRLDDRWARQRRGCRRHNPNRYTIYTIHYTPRVLSHVLYVVKTTCYIIVCNQREEGAQRASGSAALPASQNLDRDVTILHHIYIYIYMNICTYTHVYIHIHLHVSLSLSIYIYIYIYIHTCIYITFVISVAMYN